MRNFVALALTGLSIYCFGADAARAEYEFFVPPAPKQDAASSSITPAPSYTSPYPQQAQPVQSAWDEQAQDRSLEFLRQRVAELQKQNEQLHNTIAQMRSARYSQPSLENSARFQALIEENNRLANQLAQYSNGKQAQAGYLMQQLSAIQAENSALKERLAKQSGAQEKYKYQAEISKLKQENDRLQTQLASQGVQAESAQILQSKITQLTQSNADLNNQLNAALKAQQKSVSNQGQVSSLQNQVQQLTAEKNELSKGLQDARAEITLMQKKAQVPQEDLTALKTQNESLRETIRALNETLVSTNNAGQAAETLITENQVLKRQLDQAKKAQEANAVSAQGLFEENQKLQARLQEKEQQVAQVEGLKATIKQLQSEQGAPAVSASADGALQERMSILSSENRELKDSLAREKENSTAYRAKIREYQEKLASGVEPAAGGETGSAFYEKKVTSLEDNIEKQKDALNALRLENQKLKAQVDLLGKEAHSTSSKSGANTQSFSAEDLLGQEIQPIQ